MFTYLYDKLDFFLFIYAITILLIAKFSFINSKIDKDNKFWAFFSYFCVFYGLRILSDIYSLGGVNVNVVSSMLAAIAFLFLIEYARINTSSIYPYKYWKWTTYVLALFGLMSLIFFGSDNFNFVVRYGYCLLGGTWVSIILFKNLKDKRFSFLFLGITLLFFIRSEKSIYEIWNNNSTLGTIFFLLGLSISLTLLLLLNLTLNKNLLSSGIKRKDSIRYAIIFILLIMAFISTEKLGKEELYNLEIHFLQRAKTASAAINPERIKDLTFSDDDEKKPDFKRLKEQLVQIKNVNPDLRFIYILGLKKDKLHFYIDAENKESKDYSRPGETWDDAPSVAVESYKTGKDFLNGPYTDKWGTWISSFIPIKDFKTEKVKAILGVDTSAKTWKNNIMHGRLLGIIASVAIIICLLVFFVIYELGIITGEVIKKSEQKFSTVFEKSPVLTAISTLEDGRFIDVNQTFFKTLAYQNKEEIIGKTSIELKVFKNIEARSQLIKNIKQDGFIDNFEMEIQKKDGSSIVGLYYGSVIDIFGKPCLISVIEDITERKKDEQIIKENELYLRTMWNSLQAGIAVVDPETYNIIDVNPAALEILKTSREDVVGYNCSKYICGSECHNCPVIVQNKKVINKETVFKDSQGRFIPILKTVEKIELKGKEYLLENFIEISKLKEAQKKLEESEKRFKDIATNMADWMWETDENGFYTYCSEKVYNVIGYTKNEVVGKNFIDFLSPDERGITYELFMEASKRKSPINDYENKNIKKDGTEIIVVTSAVPILDRDGNLVGYRGIDKDITEKKRIEESIKKLSTAVEQSPTTIVITDTGGLIEYANPKFTSLTGYTFEEAKGLNPRILKAGDMPADHYKGLWDTIKAGHEWRGELHNKKKNGELYWENASISPIKDSNGIITHFLAVKEDITDRKKLEEALQQSQVELLKASKAKDEFLSITSHDLKSPLGIVKTSMSLLLEEKELNSSIKEYAQLSLRQANRGLKLISDLLDLKKLETGDVKLELVMFNVANLIDEVVQDFRFSYEQAGVSIEVFSDKKYSIKADYSKIGQVVSNLLSNALKYTSNGGLVKIEASLFNKKESEQVMKDYLKISVSDTGSGIPRDKLDKIFVKYEQASISDKKTGTGIGLAIAKFICELHHGEIWVDSQVGQGSTFSFILPYNEDVQAVYYDDQETLPYKILIVDDMDEQRFIARSILRKSHFSCDEASNWKEALDKIRKENFSLVLLDIEMPEIDGYKLLEIIRRENKEIPVIMFSSKTPDEKECRRLGVSSIVKKENAVTELVHSVKKILSIA